MGKGNKPMKNDKKLKKAKKLGVSIKKLPPSTKTNFGGDSAVGGF